MPRALLLPILFLGGCPLLAPHGVEQGRDPDNDGVLWPDDCDDANPDVTTLTWYEDEDNDGFGDPDRPVVQCDQRPGTVSVAADCDDADPDRNPSAEEVCDGIDNDCDGAVDGAMAVDAVTRYPDFDGDGHPDCDNALTACNPPSDWAFLDCDDCDGTSALISPSAQEVCDSVDNDCDGEIDEADAAGVELFWADNDGDGYGNGATSVQACSAPPGFVAATDDCNDADAAVNPGQSEACVNHIDDDCDGSTDEGCFFEHCDDIEADTSWDPSLPHRVNCEVTVREGATLTVLDGAEVWFAVGTGLVVERGRIMAEGTGQGIQFISAQAVPSAGDWGAIELGPQDLDSRFSGVHFAHGGRDGPVLWLGSSGAEVTSASFTANASGVGVVGSARLEDVEITGTESVGLWLEEGATVEMAAVEVSGSGDVDVEVGAAQPELLSGVLGGARVRVRPGTVQLDASWPVLDYEVAGDLEVKGPAAPVLTLSAGTTLKLRGGAIRIGDGDAGGLVAAGTPTQAVVFGSSSATPAPGDWGGVQFRSDCVAADASLGFAEVRFGGAGGLGNVVFDGCDGRVDEVLLADSAAYGLYIIGASPSLGSITYQSNGLGDTN